MRINSLPSPLAGFRPGNPEDGGLRGPVVQRVKAPQPEEVAYERLPDITRGPSYAPLILKSTSRLGASLEIAADKDITRRSSAQDIMRRSSTLTLSPEALELMCQIEELERQEDDCRLRLEDLDTLWKGRRKPLEEEMERVIAEKEQCVKDLELAEDPLQQDAMVVRAGPEGLQWVDSAWFAAMCNLVVFLNLTGMLIAGRIPKNLLGAYFWCEQLFLAFYVFELTVKASYYRRSFLVGAISVVWWNWLDLGIVVSGVIDQWLMVGLRALNITGQHASTHSSVLRAFRFLRLFRVMRVLKLLKSFLKADLKWTSSDEFQIFISGVIGVNAVVMGFELDVDWDGWKFVEHAFLVIYCFELAVRLKRWGWYFFAPGEDFTWNILDFIIVLGGVVDQWLIPLISLIKSTITNNPNASISNGSVAKFMAMLRLVRILRVLRLVRLLRHIRPLYRLLIGVFEALKSMQWVMILTLLVLYAGAIVFTSLVGRGFIYENGKAPAEAEKIFSSVTRSAFSLFRLMNGDTTIVAPICANVFGQLLFIGFMVLSNWAILAILTSVVSDNMITASAKTIQEDDDRMRAISNDKAERRLMTLFSEIDKDGSGAISEREWEDLLEDDGLRHELLDASKVDLKDLKDLYDCFATEVDTPEGIDPHLDHHKLARSLTESGRTVGGRVLYYRDFVENMRDETKPADKRSVMHVMSRLRALETRIEKRFNTLEDGSSSRKTKPLRPGAINQVPSGRSFQSGPTSI